MIKRTLTTATALAFTASAALAQEPWNGLPDDGQPHPYHILSAKDDVLIVSEDFNARANDYVLLCPSYGTMRELYTSNPEAAVMIVSHLDREALAQTLFYDYENAIKSVLQYLDVPYGHTYNNGMVAADGTVLANNNDSEMIVRREKALNQPGDIPAARLDDPQTVAKLHRHARDYCLAQY